MLDFFHLTCLGKSSKQVAPAGTFLLKITNWTGQSFMIRKALPGQVSAPFSIILLL